MDGSLARIGTVSAQGVREMAAFVAETEPSLADLSQGQLEQVARLVIAQRLTEAMGAEVDKAKIDYHAERRLFLGTVGRSDTGSTARSYSWALGLMESFAAESGLTPLDMTPAFADDWIYRVRSSGASANSVRLAVAGCSSFWAWLERRHPSLRNPFKGTKARPADENVKAARIPTADEVRILVESLPAVESAMVAVMAYRGLRADALPTLSIRGNRFTAKSKGKKIQGEMPEAALSRIRTSGLDGARPFSGLTPAAVEKRVRYRTGKLAALGFIADAYSCHKFRHHFAVQDYRAHKDIYRTSRLLFHRSIVVTQRYLRGLGEPEV